MDTGDRLRSGQQFGRYQIVRLIGEGGMGAVYEAMHPALKKRFAIKTLLPSMARTPEVRARFLREGEAAARIGHPNVVGVTDVGTEGETPYLVMEFLEGETLADLLAKRGRLEVAEALEILLPVTSAVVAGHDKGVVHRDLKPQNVFLARGHWGESIPKVLDFGVSKLTGGDNAALTGTLAVLGTAAYMSPEQARGSRHVDGQSDQYALGLVLFETVTGTRAHPGENQFEILHNITSGSRIPPRQARPDLPGALVAILDRMLALAPADRFPSLRAAGRALLPLAGERTRAAIPDAFRDPPGALATLAETRPSGSTLVLPPKGSTAPPPPSSEPGGTQLLPDLPPRRSDTTLSRAASQFTAPPAPRTTRPGSRRGWLVAGLGVPVAAVAAWAVLRPEPPILRREPAPAAVVAPTAPRQPRNEAPPRRRVEVRIEPENAELRFDDLPAVHGRLDLSIADDDDSHSLRATAAGYEPLTIMLAPHQPIPGHLKLTPLPVPTSPPRQSPPHAHRRKDPAPHPPKGAAPPPAVKPVVADPVESATPKYGANGAPIIH